MFYETKMMSLDHQLNLYRFNHLIPKIAFSWSLLIIIFLRQFGTCSSMVGMVLSLLLVVY